MSDAPVVVERPPSIETVDSLNRATEQTMNISAIPTPVVETATPEEPSKSPPPMTPIESEPKTDDNRAEIATAAATPVVEATEPAQSSENASISTADASESNELVDEVAHKEVSAETIESEEPAQQSMEIETHREEGEKSTEAKESGSEASKSPEIDSPKVAEELQSTENDQKPSSSPSVPKHEDPTSAEAVAESEKNTEIDSPIEEANILPPESPVQPKSASPQPKSPEPVAEQLANDIDSNPTPSSANSSPEHAEIAVHPVPVGQQTPPSLASEIEAKSPASPAKPSPRTSPPANASPAQRQPSNGCIPKSGKPLTFASQESPQRQSRASSTAAAAAASTSSSSSPSPAKSASPAASRKRPAASKAMYHSQISDNTSGIKLKLKKSPDMAVAIGQASNAIASTITGHGAAKPKARNVGLGRSPKAASRKRSKQRVGSDDDPDAEDDGGGGGGGGGNGKRVRKPTAAAVAVAEDPAEQSDWGHRLPELVLHAIFSELVRTEGGCVPAMVQAGRVCRLWHRVSLRPSLWRVCDLSAMKERCRTEQRLQWLIEHRLGQCVELDLSNWKVVNIQQMLFLLSQNLKHLESLHLGNWKNFTSDDLLFMTNVFKKMRRINLSSINLEIAHKSVIAVGGLLKALQEMGERLTHMNLANNKLAGIPQIIATLSTSCPNLVLLDLGNVATVSCSHGILHIEKLQHGCPKLKVLRLSYARVTLSNATLQEQLDSPGFPELEELTFATFTNESRMLSNEFVSRILKNSTKLERLNLRGAIRVTHECLIRLQAWNLRSLTLSGCGVATDKGSGLELVVSKWAHSLLDLDLAWSNNQESIDAAMRVLSDKGDEAVLVHLDLCGSSVSKEVVRDLLLRCGSIQEINLSSCRSMPRGYKRAVSDRSKLDDLLVALGAPRPIGINNNSSTSNNNSTAAAEGAASTST